ncbi:hypothetical protein RP300_00283 [Oligella urethralis]|uniref:helix-turn-helix transcriptional regulator n=1 Tax=Oligella urethralis TaxID=90245 RepID=UPI000DFF2691|nr:hypothetical protein [Oligella urethralis]WOS36753.1 hypothetical protein RP300_00283 [Oligella urethralis]SUA57578.1 Uncharacterised protein [Oligella urethralis]SUA62997.1 Uncharacterised protein [Oligella urethralis]
MTNTVTATLNPTRWYDIKAIAEAFSVSVNTVHSWRQRKQMPAPDIQQHRFTRWKAETIEPFINDPITWREENKDLEGV